MSEQESLLPLTDLQRGLLESAIQDYQFELATAAGVREYLAGRGLKQATLDGARLGVVSDPPSAGHENYAGWLAIPYLDKNGAPLTVRFRCLQHLENGCKAEGHKMKYASISHDPARTYNVGAIHRAARGDGTINICEGELDALVLQQAGLNAIALPGASAWRPRHRIMLAGFNEVNVWADPDDAGDQLATTILKSMRNARRIRLTHGDVTETCANLGEAGLLALLGEEKK